jgi:hypothetical protein
MWSAPQISTLGGPEFSASALADPGATLRGAGCPLGGPEFSASALAYGTDHHRGLRADGAVAQVCQHVALASPRARRLTITGSLSAAGPTEERASVFSRSSVANLWRLHIHVRERQRASNEVPSA